MDSRKVKVSQGKNGEGVLKYFVDNVQKTYTGYFFLVEENHDLISAAFREEESGDEISFHFPFSKLGTEIKHSDEGVLVSFNQESSGGSFPWNGGKIKVERDVVDNKLYFGSLSAYFGSLVPVKEVKKGIFSIKEKLKS